MAELIAIRTFMKLKVLDAIPTSGSISLKDLSEATGAQESLLERLGRILVATGFLDQTLPDGGNYKHTRFSLSYLTSQPSPGHLFLAIYDNWFKNMHNFDDYLEAHNQLQRAKEPDDQLRNPYTWNHKQDGTPVWAIMAQNPEKLATFQIGMSGLDISIPVLGHFDFSVLRSDNDNARMQLVDVGGGSGAVLKQILDYHQDLNPEKCVLQDRPEVIEITKANKTSPKDVVLMPHDFHREQSVKNAKAYFMRLITHSYADSVCVNILSQLSKAMGSDSRVLVCDIVIPQRVGETDFAAMVLDQTVMTAGGKERIEVGFRSLFKSAGLQLVQLWKVPGVPGACVERRLKF